MSFLYNDQGLRTQKIVGDTTITYTWSGTTLLSEATDTYILIYLYDESASPIGFQYRDSEATETYFFEKNLQGDIVAVYSEAGVKLVSYAYDAWGNANISFHNGGENTNATKNPFTYRGYYYDQDLGLYYLQSRYYDPAIGRFINADGLDYLGANGDLNSYNLYAYCSNNPVMYTDPSGHFAIWVMVLVGTLIGAAFGFGFDAGKQLNKNGGDFSKVDWGSAINSGIVGGALGFSLAMGVGYLGPAIAGTSTVGSLTAGGAFAISTAVSFGAGSLGYASEEWINGRAPSFGETMMHGSLVALEGAVEFGVGGVVGSIGNVGTKGKFLVSKEWWGKMILGLEFSQPFKIGIDLIRKNV